MKDLIHGTGDLLAYQQLTIFFVQVCQGVSSPLPEVAGKPLHCVGIYALGAQSVNPDLTTSKRNWPCELLAHWELTVKSQVGNVSVLECLSFMLSLLLNAMQSGLRILWNYRARLGHLHCGKTSPSTIRLHHAAHAIVAC